MLDRPFLLFFLLPSTHADAVPVRGMASGGERQDGVRRGGMARMGGS